MNVAPTPSREQVLALRRIQQPRPAPRWRRLLKFASPDAKRRRVPPAIHGGGTAAKRGA